MKEERTPVELLEQDEVRAPAAPGNGHEAIAHDNGLASETSREPLAKDKSREGFNMDLLVGYVLAGGVITSMVLIAAGIIWHWATTGSLGLEYRLGGMSFFQFVLSDVRAVVQTGFGPRRMINLGIAVLMLTPYVRVASSMVYFGVIEHNWKYTIFTGFVLSVLTYSLFLR
jgi:uncharacterized membrane protein